MNPRSVAVLVAVVLVAPAVHAFPAAGDFDNDSVESVGGDGVTFVGSPRFASGTCDSCHTGGERHVGVRFGVAPTSLLDRGYDPSAVYELEVELTGEHVAVERDAAGPRCGGSGKSFVPCNTNGFQLEADDLLGEPLGRLCPVPFTKDGACPSTTSNEAALSADGRAAAPNGFLDASGGLPAGAPNGATRWHLYWRAPGTGSGPVTFHVGVVDGSGGDGTQQNQADTANDDVAMAHIAADESDQAPPAATTAGCRSDGSGARELGPSLLALALFGLLGRARRRR